MRTKWLFMRSLKNMRTKWLFMRTEINSNLSESGNINGNNLVVQLNNSELLIRMNVLNYTTIFDFWDTDFWHRLLFLSGHVDFLVHLASKFGEPVSDREFKKKSWFSGQRETMCLSMICYIFSAFILESNWVF